MGPVDGTAEEGREPPKRSEGAAEGGTAEVGASSRRLASGGTRGATEPKAELHQRQNEVRQRAGRT